MPPIIKDLLLSKKFVVALLTMAGSIAAYKGWNVDPMTILPLIIPPLVYIGAQGWADSGKEKAKIDAAAAIQIHTMAMQHGAAVTALAPQGAQADQDKPAVTVVTKSTPSGTAGFARISVMTIIATLLGSVFVGMLFYAPAASLGGCAHPGQATLRAGQCLLDDGVLADVLAALGTPDYLKQVENVGLKRAGDLIDCALQAASTQPSGTSSGSGSVVVTSALTATAAPSSTIASRAREALAARRAAGK